MPVRRTTVAVLALWVALAVGSARAEEAAIPLDPSSAGSGPLALYRDKKYDEAFKAFSDLAKENPDQGSLQFDAGASAYMDKQYDEALEAFGRALVAPDPALRAKSQYNFGNTLYRRGQTQYDRASKIKDWRNAIQYYDATLAALRGSQIPDPGHTLAANAAYNRDLVQRRLDEELKQPPPPTPTPTPTPNKDDKKDQKDQKKGDKNQQQQQDRSQDKGDGQQQQQQDAQNGQQPKQPQPQQSQDKGGSSSSQQEGGQNNANQPQDGSSNQPPKPDSQPPQPGNTPSSGGEPQPDQQQKGGRKPQDGQRNPSQGNDNAQNSPQDGKPDPNGDPHQNEPRRRGDFKAQSEQKNDPQAASGQQGEDGQVPEQLAHDEAGKMSAAQAKALLDSLKGEDARVLPSGLDRNRHNRDEAPVKDW